MRKGQWAKVEGKLAIHVGGNQFHLVAADGTTVCDENQRALVVTSTNAEEVTDVSELPEWRRAHLPQGYNPATRVVEAV